MTWPTRCCTCSITYDDPTTINVGVGTDVTIRELAELVARIVGYEGEIVQDTSKPDGTPRKLLDVSRLTELGWTASTPLETGVAEAHRWVRRTPRRGPSVTRARLVGRV